MKNITIVEVLVLIVIVGILVVIALGGASLENNPPIQKIDGCEYIYWDIGENSSLTHKGNCSNPIHYKAQNVE